MKRVRLRDVFIPVALLILCLIAYGPLIPSLGVYWDDWPSLWFLHFYGPGVFPKAFAIDRPAQGYLFTVTSALIGESMLIWQVFGILARWLCGLALYGLLGLVWPQHKSKAVWVAALFLIYPGFTQQYIPITYGHQFLVYTVFLASLTLMVKANLRGFQKPVGFNWRYWALTAAGLLLAIWSMFALEYFFGLELLRPALLLLALINGGAPASRKGFALLRQVLLRWLPYAVAAGLFLTWRLSHPTPRGNVVIFERLAAAPGAALVGLATTILQDIFAAAVVAWQRAAAFANPLGVKLSVLAAYWLVALAAAGLMAWLVLKTAPHPKAFPGRQEPGIGKGPGWAVQAILLGLYALFIGGWPVWVTDLRLELAFPWDRFTLPLIPGAALVLAGLIDLLPRRWPKVVLLAALVGLAAGMHFYVALDYRRDWRAQKDFFWQLAWRAPWIEPGTLLLASASPFAYSTDNSLSAPVNWIYAPDLHSFEMPYLVYALDARLGDQLPELVAGQTVEQDYRATRFEGNTSQTVVLFYDPPRCLKVLDPRLDADLPNKPDFIEPALPLSRPELIWPAHVNLDVMESLFGPEPGRGWCYYFEQAELAVQQGDWQRAADLAGPALAALPDLGREQAYELLPFIQGYAYTDDWPAALALSRRSAELFPGKMPAILCDLWNEITARMPAPPDQAAGLAQAREQWSCQSR